MKRYWKSLPAIALDEAGDESRLLQFHLFEDVLDDLADLTDGGGRLEHSGLNPLRAESIHLIDHARLGGHHVRRHQHGTQFEFHQAPKVPKVQRSICRCIFLTATLGLAANLKASQLCEIRQRVSFWTGQNKGTIQLWVTVTAEPTMGTSGARRRRWPRCTSMYMGILAFGSSILVAAARRYSICIGELLTEWCAALNSDTPSLMPLPMPIPSTNRSQPNDTDTDTEVAARWRCKSRGYLQLRADKKKSAESAVWPGCSGVSQYPCQYLTNPPSRWQWHEWDSQAQIHTAAHTKIQIHVGAVTWQGSLSRATHSDA